MSDLKSWNPNRAVPQMLRSILYIALIAVTAGCAGGGSQTGNAGVPSGTPPSGMPPSITSLTPISGPVGASVTITGMNFGAQQGASTVTFNGTAATPASWNSRNVVVPVPAGATSGNVVVTVAGAASNGAFFTVTPASGANVKFPIRASANGRYFTDANGVPWLMVADAAHHLMSSLPQASLTSYLADRQTNGFNAIDFYGSNPSSSSSNGAAQDGTLPFTVGSNMATYDLCGTFTPPYSCTSPNLAYWAEVDNVVNQATGHNIVALMNPLPWGNGFSGAFTNSINSANSGQKIYNFGLWLGNRYKNFPNIIWYVGQDFSGNSLPTGSNLLLVAQLMAGIKAADPNHLIAAQLNYYISFSQQADAIVTNPPSLYQPNLSASFLYSYYEQYGVANAAYGNANSLPQYLGESNYETANNTRQLNDTKYGKGGTAANAFITRLEMWWSMTTGDTGFEFGNEHVSHFDSSYLTNLDTTATSQVKYLAQLFNTLNWSTFAPDTAHAIVISGYGTSGAANANLYNATYATTTWDGVSTAVIYTPVSTTLTVNLANFRSNPVVAQWYDPTTGSYTAAGSFSNLGSQKFTTPLGPHTDGTGANDWVLVLQ